jgi:hypothetical protein
MLRCSALVLLVLLAATREAVGQDARDAAILDPDHHHVIMDNDHVRVFEVLAAPGDTSPMHTHPPLVLVSLDKARVRIAGPDGSASILDLNPGAVLWLENVEHTWKLLAGQIHLFAVEVKAARAGGPAAPIAPGADEAVAVDPTHHNVVFENDHVRVFEAMAATGDASPMHTHPPTVLISTSVARMRVALPDGSSSILDLHPAQPVWLDGDRHSWEILSGQLGAFGVEIKAARRSSAGG